MTPFVRRVLSRLSCMLSVIAISLSCTVLQVPASVVQNGPCAGPASTQALSRNNGFATSGANALAPLLTWGLTCGPPRAPSDVSTLTAPTPQGTFRFVHLTDAQIHERGYRWSETFANAPGDTFYESRSVIKSVFYNDVGQAHYLLRLFTALKRGAERGDIAFVAHTGDAVHFNFASEWAVYNRLVHRYLTGAPPSPWSRIPIEGSDAFFLNGLGNHDVLQLGIFTPGDPLTALAFTPRMSREAGHALGDTERFIEQTWALPPGGHAFGATQRPYSAHDVILPRSFGERRARIIMLNTADQNVACGDDIKGLNGGLGEEQSLWLRETLKAADRDRAVALTLVFGHHGARSTRTAAAARCDNGTHVDVKGTSRSGPEGLASILSTSQKVVAYLSGHVHTPMPPAWVGDKRRILDIVSPGLVEFPKCATVVDLVAERDEQDGACGVRVKTRCVGLDDIDDFTADDIALVPAATDGSVDPERFFLDAYQGWRDELFSRPQHKRSRTTAATTLAGAATDWFLYRNEEVRTGRREPAGHHPMRWPRDAALDCGNEMSCLSDDAAVYGHLESARAWWAHQRRRTDPMHGVFVPLASACDAL